MPLHGALPLKRMQKHSQRAASFARSPDVGQHVQRSSTSRQRGHSVASSQKASLPVRQANSTVLPELKTLVHFHKATMLCTGILSRLPFLGTHCIAMHLVPSTWVARVSFSIPTDPVRPSCSRFTHVNASKITVPLNKILMLHALNQTKELPSRPGARVRPI